MEIKSHDQFFEIDLKFAFRYCPEIFSMDAPIFQPIFV